MGLGSQSTEDFSGGMYRGRRAPANALYDLENGLINDEGQPFQRTGSAYWSSSDAAVSLEGIVTADLIGPDAERVLAWGGTKLYVFDGSEAPLELFDDTTATLPYGRSVGVGGVLLFPLAPDTSGVGIPRNNRILAYGGSLLPAGGASNVGTVTVTAGSVAVTKSGGASWVGAVDAGMFLGGISGSPFGIIRSVDGADALTLVSPWGGATASTGTYEVSPVLDIHLLVGTSPLVPVPPLADRIHLGTSGQRLLVGAGNRIYEAARGFPFVFDADVYQEIPAGMKITGMEGLGDTSLIFSTGGVWGITNLSLDPVDAYGNIQQAVQRITGDVTLWGEHSLVSWGGGVIAAGLDDVYLVGADGTRQPITGGRNSQYDGGIRNLYRAHVGAGYTPGVARVYRGHLFLPILDGTTVVDLLVCRLDHGFAWSRWSGHAACSGYAVRSGAEAEVSKLLGTGGTRALDLTGCFDPSTEHVFDADGSIFDTTIITRDYPTGQQPGIFTKARARYEQVSAGFGGDNFNRPDGALGGGWLAWSDNLPHIADGAAVGEDGEDYDDATQPEAVGPDCSITALFAVPLVDLTNIGLGLRLTTHTAAANGYMMETRDIGAGPEVTLYKGSGFTTIATASSIPAGVIDGASLVITGATLFGLLRIDGAWTEVVTVTGQSDYPLAGYPGFWVTGLNGVTQVSWGGTGAAPAPVRVAFTSDADEGAWTDLTDTGEQGGADGWGLSDGSKYQWATVGKRRERGRFRITVPGGAASFVLRSIELLSRQSGKQ